MRVRTGSAGAQADREEAKVMPYRRCPECGITVHSVGGYSTPSACSVCGTALPEEAKRFARDASGIRRTLTREPVAAGSARRVLRGLGGEIEQEVRDVAALLVTELIANSVLHAGPDAGEHLELEVAVMPDRVRVEVRDRGPGFAWHKRPKADPLGFHWGLQLVEKLASRWDIEPGDDTVDTVVWFELDRAKAA